MPRTNKIAQVFLCANVKIKPQGPRMIQRDQEGLSKQQQTSQEAFTHSLLFISHKQVCQLVTGRLHLSSYSISRSYLLAMTATVSEQPPCVSTQYTPSADTWVAEPGHAPDWGYTWPLLKVPGNMQNVTYYIGP